MDYEAEISQLFQVSDPTKEDFRTKKKLLTAKYKQYLQSQNKDEKEISQGMRKFRAAFREKKAETKVVSGAQTLEPLLQLNLADSRGVKFTIGSYIDGRIRDVVIPQGLDAGAVMDPAFKKGVDIFATSLTDVQSTNLKKNLTAIKQAVRRQAKRGTRTAKRKTIMANTRKYFGANDLSYAKSREAVYSFWETVSKDYVSFKNSLDKVIKGLEEYDVSISSIEQGSTRGPVAQDPRGAETAKEIRDLPEYKRKLQELKQLAEGNLEYIGSFEKASVRITEDPKARLIEALDRIITAKNLSDKKERTYQNYKDDEPSAQAAWEQAYLEEGQAKTAGKGRGGEVEMGLADDEELSAEEKAFEEYLEKEYDATTDPLLAYELMQNKKLLALTQESEELLKNTIEELRKDDILVDFKTDLYELNKQVDDSLTIDKTSFALPISVLSNDEFSNYIKVDTVAGAETREELSVDVLEELDELFEKLHALLGDSKFGFAGGVRTSARSASLGSITERREARGTSVQRLFEEGKRRVPINITNRPKLNPKAKAIMSDLKEMLENFAKYYMDPLLSGKLPIEIPSYSRGRGARALVVLLKDAGGLSVSSDAFEMLSTTGKATIAVGTLRDLANFLTKFQTPNIEVNTTLIKLAESASIALSKMFGNKEKNHNYFSAALYHFMEEIGDMGESDTDFFGKSIRRRAKAWEASWKKNEPQPIFGLPAFIDQNQSLFTKDTKRKVQYDRLREVLDEVEDDLPLIFNKMIKAHDEIRKAMGKEIRHGFLPLKYQSYDSMVDMMHKQEQIDLSHYEVESIVKSDDAHRNISQEFGITEDQVYLIKANFR
jgi:hypothetical protein